MSENDCFIAKFVQEPKARSTVKYHILVVLYFWKFYPDVGGTGTCTVRPEVTAGDMASVWSVWSWVTELLVFGAVPLVILLLNVLVIKELRVVSANDISRFDAVSSVRFDAVSSVTIASTRPRRKKTKLAKKL